MGGSIAFICSSPFQQFLPLNTRLTLITAAPVVASQNLVSLTPPVAHNLVAAVFDWIEAGLCMLAKLAGAWAVFPVVVCGSDGNLVLHE